ncbi:hypothetical protein FOPG_16368 [Fusarium oxysporum f. sp. conglutinans race 2 54008]|uniref:Major facilitator superfamily (MFS) profile domain-containing protein n=1 Tax=Fusarium oxysporum f. sp. conglutinans race 2 54008 TaxID=1089457 RepID=X0GV46_FUSOX|nr:hypothetical protein FOPG_16368 [Fusarium oxysporum f. sp. conglutinans race 2 54008]
MSSHPPSSPPSSVVRFPSSQRIVENWKWKGAILTIYMTCIINGFDVSNVANIQPQLYVAFGHIEYLPWIGLSYSLANFATLSFAGRILDIFDIRHIYLASIVVFAAGAALAGSAKTISAIIAGRAVMGIGGSICQNCAISYFSMYASDSQGPFLYGILSSLWAVGLVIGGPVGSALAEKVTWRWAFYINLPFLGFAFVCAVVFLPRRRSHFDLPLRHRIAKFAGLDIILQTSTTVATIVLFAIAATFSGPVWSWSSVPCYTTWAVFAAVFVLCGTLHCTRFTAAIKDRLHTSFKSVPDRRVIPIELMGRRNILPLWIVSGCAGATYAVTLYYLPLFYAFSKGHGALQQTIRMLPFILTFIVTVLIVGAFLSKIKQYGVIYVVGGATTLASGTSLAIILDSDVSESKVMGLTALIGIGLGFQFQHGNAISNTINKTLRDRVESAALLNMSLMGGISTALIMAGAIYENRGMALLPSTLEPFHYDDKTIREALAGVSPTVWEGAETNITAYGADATTQAISSLLYIISSSGALCLFCGALILWDMKLKRGYRENAVATV